MLVMRISIFGIVLPLPLLFDDFFASSPKSIKVNVSKDAISLETKLDVDYWEVDPDWDGKLFRSVAQAKRPVRNGDIPMEIKLKAGSNFCIRLVSVKGKQYQLNIQAVSDAANGL